MGSVTASNFKEARRIDAIQQRLEETQGSVESEATQNKATFDVHRQVFASLSQRLDALEEKGSSKKEVLESFRCNDSSDEKKSPVPSSDETTPPRPQGIFRQPSAELPLASR